MGKNEDMDTSASFSSPLCTLKQISCMMDCKALGVVNTHETTLPILHMLSHYSWGARAVMTLAAFALDFGEFCILMRIHSSNQLANSLAFLKGLPVLAEPPGLQKHKQALADLVSLNKAALEVIRCIFELQKLPNYGTENVPALSKTLDHVPVDVYWVVRTVVGCSAQMIRVTNDEYQSVDLSSLAHNLDSILNNLKKQLNICKQQIEETETAAYQTLRNLFQIHPKIVEVFKALCYGKSNLQPLIDGSNQFNEIDFDVVLKHKYVLLLISGPDMSDNDLRTLKQLHREIGNRGKIVWVPLIVGQTSIDTERMFRNRSSEVPLYLVQQFLHILPGIKFIKEEWHFRNEAIVVVINPKVRVEHCISLQQIKGIDSFSCFRRKHIDVLVDGICRCACQCLCAHRERTNV
ncbi:hypothetical protein FH972_008385 [Carpinus fangiana]|uniref:Sieve element occlusion N-terminal domain-containing protein n=2 Tax=Carpinus fangiana TaxID=176857 RepID=A0A5N6QZD3_9ROSI|nr:hypothetical protein FH972_008385 [Carpinus fangiana]